MGGATGMAATPMTIPLLEALWGLMALDIALCSMLFSIYDTMATINSTSDQVGLCRTSHLGHFSNQDF